MMLPIPPTGTPRHRFWTRRRALLAFLTGGCLAILAIELLFEPARELTASWGSATIEWVYDRLGASPWWTYVFAAISIPFIWRPRFRVHARNLLIDCVAWVCGLVAKHPYATIVCFGTTTLYLLLPWKSVWTLTPSDGPSSAWKLIAIVFSIVVAPILVVMWLRSHSIARQGFHTLGGLASAGRWILGHKKLSAMAMLGIVVSIFLFWEAMIHGGDIASVLWNGILGGPELVGQFVTWSLSDPATAANVVTLAPVAALLPIVVILTTSHHRIRSMIIYGLCLVVIASIVSSVVPKRKLAELFATARAHPHPNSIVTAPKPLTPEQLVEQERRRLEAEFRRFGGNTTYAPVDRWHEIPIGEYGMCGVIWPDTAEPRMRIQRLVYVDGKSRWMEDRDYMRNFSTHPFTAYRVQSSTGQPERYTSYVYPKESSGTCPIPHKPPHLV